jgi:hypothetical protein
MPDTHFILHVKGTEGETAELPKEAVLEGISQGTITESQLIWSKDEQAWKQVKELPELLVGERLILHVKGTEAEIKELPKRVVQGAVSKGKITLSQLIWSPAQSAWKQVKELPELLPTERVILHVKGTESETRQLPKEEVRAAISQGTITQSQLIWIPEDNTWKQVKEVPDLMPGESLILHVKGTESETKQVPKKAVRSAISHGEITHSQLIWSPDQHAWKQVRDLPELLPSQKLAPAPAREVAHYVPKVAQTIIPESPGGLVARAAASATATPRVRVAVATGSPPKVWPTTASAGAPLQPGAEIASGSVPKVRADVPSAEAPRVRVAEAGSSTAVPQVRVATASASVPKVRVASASPGVPQPRKIMAASVVRAAGSVQASVRSSGDLKVDEHDESHPLKWVCIGLGALILFVLGANYLLVDQPLASGISQTPYSKVTVYGHLGAFLQPNVIVIHIPRSAAITPDNLVDFLVTLAHNTPENQLTRDIYARVALTSGWTAQYSFSGYNWMQLGEMTHDSEGQRKEFIMAQMGDGNGDPVLPESTLNQQMSETEREQVWNAFIAHFTASP